MAYLALYRRYRPTTFSKLIGQNHIVKILKNQIREDKVGHAYLFTGARGTGKTSAAKIFARAINCLKPVDGSPCGKCEVCKVLSESNNMDILEIDAASNNRVDEVRDIREKVQYPPVSGRFKVYIVDEVHMLTDSAFNALLKTLEEPPSHAVFILATTEPQKLPATILSRCMRFDFRLISETEIAKLIEGIFQEIKLEYEPEAVRLIARSGEGSVRDSLSLADKCVSFGEGKLKYQDVLEVLGGADRGKITALVSDILRGEVGGVLFKIDELVGLGKSIQVLAKDLAAVFRDIAIVKSVADANSILNIPADKLEELKGLADGEDAVRILRCLEQFSGVEQELRHSLNPRILLETTALRCARPANDLTAEGLLVRMNQLEKQLAEWKQTGASAAVPAIPAARSKAVPAEEIKAEPPAKAAAPVKSKTLQKADSGKAWAELVGKVRKGANQLLFNVIKSAEAEVIGKTLTIVSADPNAETFLKKPEMRGEIKRILTELGYDLEVAVQIPEGAAVSQAEPWNEKLEKVKQVLGTEDVTVK